MKPISVKRQKHSGDVRREQIIHASLRIIGKKGVSGLTTTAIAREVGISEANLYRHFRNKDEILYETGKGVGEGIRKNLASVLEAPAQPLEKLRKAFAVHLDYIEKNGGIPRLGFSEEMHIGNEKLKKEFLRNIELYSSGLESLVKEGQRAGDIRDDTNAKALATMLIGMVQVSVMKWSLSGFSFSLAAEGRKLWKNFEKCITAGRPARRGS